MSKLIIESRLGATDCTECRIYRKGHLILAKILRTRGNDLTRQYPALATKVAELPSEYAAEQALQRIRFASEAAKNIDTEQITVNLRDLEGH